MKTPIYAAAFVMLLAVAAQVKAQTPSASPSAETRGVELEKVIADVAKKSGKKFIVDPRVRAQVTMIGASPANADYAALLGVLEVHGFAAVESGGFVHVVPAGDMRFLPVPTVVGNKQYLDGEVVTKIIVVKSMSAPQLVPLLRPMLPQYAHLAALACTNTVLIVDRYANVQRIAGVIEAMDKGEPYKTRDCSVEEIKK